MENLSIITYFIFIIALVLTFYFVLKVGGCNRYFGFVLLLVLGVHSVAAVSGFYVGAKEDPARFALLLLPSVIAALIIAWKRSALPEAETLFASLILLHIVRIPVEFTLLLLSEHKLVPELMTFEGSNPDILSGLSAIAVFVLYKKKIIGRTTVLIWNICGLALLINIVARAILSAPMPFQQLAFGQPNVALLYFPFILLPAFIVPAVLFSHAFMIRYLICNAHARHNRLVNETR